MDMLAPALDAADTHSGAQFFVLMLERLGFRPQSDRPQVLVVGCGTGHEAAHLQLSLNAVVDAVDLEVEPDAEFESIADLRFQQASALQLPFEDQSFDAVFYHHVIEHVSDPVQSLVEIRRVLRDDGWLFIGTPNRHRLLSSVGAHRQATWEPSLANKLRDNLQDWGARFKGQFRNECGAHAGFSQGELDHMLAAHFATRHWLTREYLRFKYEQQAVMPLVRLATTKPVSWFMAPSIYVMCQA